MFDLIIIGGGPAGLTAAIYAARNNLKVGIVEKNVPGGQMVNTATVENYPGFKTIEGPTLAYTMFDQVMSLGVEYFSFAITAVEKVDDYFVVTGDEEIMAKTVIISTGTLHKKIGAIGEERLTGRGISWCAICDGTFYKGMNVAAIGGGNSAFEEAIYLSSLAKNVYLIHHREGFRAEENLINKVKSIPNIKMILNYKVIEFIGEDKLDQLRILNVKTNEETYLEVDGCFEFIGHMPATAFLKNLGIVEPNGYINVDKNCETKIPGLFACGDVVNKDVRQIATAINDGAIAALNINRYVK